MKIIITIKDTNNIIGLKEDIAMRLEGVADIVRIDTADVAPKSEVERLEHLRAELSKEIETLKDNNEHLAVLLAEAKSEVAREIFEEIDDAIENLRGAFLRQRISELKKKYIEEIK